LLGKRPRFSKTETEEKTEKGGKYQPLPRGSKGNIKKAKFKGGESRTKAVLQYTE